MEEAIVVIVSIICLTVSMIFFIRNTDNCDCEQKPYCWFEYSYKDESDEV